MKKVLIGILLLGALFLTACGDRPAPEPAEPEGILCGEWTEPSPRPYLMMEREVYDPSLTAFTYFVVNDGEEPLEFGEAYHIQRLAGAEWQDLTPRENWGFTAIGYYLDPGGEMALTCTLDRYQEPPEPGTYQLVKSVGDTALYAEFQLGESPYTAETPYGFGPLEDLPEDYRAAPESDNCVIFLKTGVKNEEAVEEFLFKAGLGAPCQLRTVQYRAEGTPFITDTIYETGHFLQRTREDGIVSERRFSYLVTDGEDLYLSNGADWASGARYHDSRAPLIPGGTAEMVSAVEAMTAARLESNITRYRVWSSDGSWDAALTDTPAEFSVGWQKPGEGSWGGVYNLQDWDGMETAVTGLAWREDGTLLLICETASGGGSKLVFDPETKRLNRLEICGLPLAEDTPPDPA